MPGRVFGHEGLTATVQGRTRHGRPYGTGHIFDMGHRAPAENPRSVGRYRNRTHGTGTMGCTIYKKTVNDLFARVLGSSTRRQTEGHCAPVGFPSRADLKYSSNGFGSGPGSGPSSFTRDPWSITTSSARCALTFEMEVGGIDRPYKTCAPLTPGPESV